MPLKRVRSSFNFVVECRYDKLKTLHCVTSMHGLLNLVIKREHGRSQSVINNGGLKFVIRFVYIIFIMAGARAWNLTGDL